MQALQNRLHLPAVTLVVCTLGTAGCANLPDATVLTAHRSAQSVWFENARGPVSDKQSAALLAALKRSAGNLDVLDKHMALEQSITDSPLILGNKTTLLQDGPATYTAMFAAIAGAQDHINLESYIIEDDAVGREFAQLLLAQQRRGIQVNF